MAHQARVTLEGDIRLQLLFKHVVGAMGPRMVATACVIRARIHAPLAMLLVLDEPVIDSWSLLTVHY